MSFITQIFRYALYIPFYNLLIFFAWATSGSVGWSIVILTVIIRFLLLPSSLKAAKAGVLMQALQPKMNELREKHKADPKKLNEEMMKLYKEEGTSPWGSCLPILIQLPIVFILYQVFQIGLDTSHYGLLYSFVPRPDTLKTMFIGFDLAGKDPWILPIVAGASQMLLSWMTMPKADPKQKSDPMMMMNKQMIFIFPLITIFIARSVPAALVIYWIVTTIFGIGQQWYVNKNIRNSQAMKKEIAKEEKIIESLEDKGEVRPKPAKKDMMTRVMQGRLDKQDKKKGVSITIRKK